MSAELPEWCWYKIAELGDLDDGRVRTAQAGHQTIALSRCGDRYGVLDNHCPATELDNALREGLAHDGPALIEVITDPELV